MYKLNKKGEALFFLMELLVISVIIIIFAGATYSMMTSEAKHFTFDSYNLGLFLERIPSIEGNFQYEFTFENPVSVEFKPDYIALDEPGIEARKFSVSYLNPPNFQLEREFKDVEKLYFYKYGNKLEVSDNKSSLMESLLHSKEFTVENLTTYFVSQRSIKEIDAQNVEFVLGANVVTQFSETYVIDNPVGKLLWIQSDVKKDGFQITYNQAGRDYANQMYNKLYLYAESADLGDVTLAPMTSNYTLMDTYVPVIVTNSEDFSIYLAGLRQ